MLRQLVLGQFQKLSVQYFDLTLNVRDGHGGGWSRKINARYLHTLMVYL
jgi:hypothetical protein